MDNTLQRSEVMHHLWHVTKRRKHSHGFNLLNEGWTERRSLGISFFYIYFSFSPQPSDVLSQQGKGTEMSFLWRCDQRSFASKKGSVLNILKLSVLFVGLVLLLGSSLSVTP